MLFRHGLAAAQAPAPASARRSCERAKDSFVAHDYGRVEEKRAAIFNLRGDSLRTLFIPVAVLAAFVFSLGASAQAVTPKTSGVYLSSADYKNGRLAFQGDSGSETHKLELHDVLNKPYIEVTHDTEKHRHQKGDLFGFRACDGRDYRFASNREYQILEAKELYIYARGTPVGAGKGIRTVAAYYFSVGPDGPVLALTLENLKQSFPDNHRFHDNLDAMFGPGQVLAEYDEFHKTFKVNRLLIASREWRP